MRIVIDMQAAQTASGTRGIGRYAMSLAKAIVRNKGEHEVVLALNGMLPDAIESIRASFNGLLPQEHIRVWYAAGPVAWVDTSNHGRRQAAQIIREAFLVSLKPDVVLISSLFEGLGDDAVTSIGVLSKEVPTAVVLYDLIPFIHPKLYLEDPVAKDWYLRKIEFLKEADLFLAISESSRKEGTEYLSFDEQCAINISSDADPFFHKIDVPNDRVLAIAGRYGIIRPFMMYTGGIDHRKNIEGLIRAFSNLPKAIRENHQLAVVCTIQADARRLLE